MNEREELAALRRLAELEAKAGNVPKEAAPKPNPFSLNMDRVNAVGQSIKDITGGLTRSGMGVVSNLMRPFEALAGEPSLSLSDLVTGNKPMTPHEQRMARISKRYDQQGYDQDSLSFKGGKLAGDVAITAPIGGALATGVKAIPMLTKAAPNLAPALASGGFRLAQPAVTTAGKIGNAALRTGAGGVVGATAAGTLNLDDAGTGATIGAAMPGGVKVSGMAGKLLNQGAKSLVKNTLGLSTGAGADAVSMAYKAGKTGNQAFLENMRGGGSVDDIIGQAKSALQNMRSERAAAYRSGMANIKGDKSIIDFSPIRSSINSIQSMGSFKGQQINKNASGTVDEIAQKVNEWEALNPAEYHTPEGLDALKQAIGDIRDATQFGTPARRAADSVYNAIKAEINKQAPTYAKVMKDYTNASEALREVEKTFSLGEKAAQDTSMRKLLSLMRNNVNTNFSNRTQVAQKLVDSGATDLLPAIAGKSLSSATPRGLQGLAATGTGLYSLTNPAAIAALPMQSPRLIGEALYGAGRVAGTTGNILRNTQQNALGTGLLNPALTDATYTIGRTLPLAISVNR